MANTALTRSSVQLSWPPINETWKSYPLIRMLSMSNKPICGQLPLFAAAKGMTPAPWISSSSALNSSHVVGTVYPGSSNTLFR